MIWKIMFSIAYKRNENLIANIQYALDIRLTTIAMKVIFVINIFSIFVEQIVGNGIDLIALPDPEHNVSSILCIVKFCEKYFRSEKAVIGSLVIVNIQNTTEFHDQFIMILNSKINYELGIMVKDSRRKHGNPVHVTDKAKNYFVIFNETSEVIGALRQWYAVQTQTIMNCG